MKTGCRLQGFGAICARVLERAGCSFPPDEDCANGCKPFGRIMSSILMMGMKEVKVLPVCQARSWADECSFA